jgi:hypothetical protein
MDLRELNFGIEIETVGRERELNSRAVREVVGGVISHVGDTFYDTWEVIDDRNRTWKIMADSSLNNTDFDLQAEIVSPILQYPDIEELQEVVRSVRRAGAEVDHQCGIHLHVDAAPFDGRTLANLTKIVYKQEALIYKALGVQPRREVSYTKRVCHDFIEQLKARKPKTKEDLKPLWYGESDPYVDHYHSSRYHGLNLHNVWYLGTVEFRLFEATLHAGKVKAYIQFALALAAKALRSKSAPSKQRVFNTDSAKYDFRVFLLGLGLIGDEFKTARLHLLSKLSGDSAFKNGRRQRVA